MTALVYGACVLVTARFLRANVSTPTIRGREWMRVEHDARRGIYLGPRTLRNGEVHSDGDGHALGFRATGDVVRAALVSFGPHMKPRYVPLDALEAFVQEGGSVTGGAT